MIKLIFGILILFVQVKNLLEAGPRPVPTTPEAYYTMQGEQGAQIAFTILGIVLIIWGIRSMMKKAKASKEEKMKLSLWEMFKQVFSDFPKFLESFIGKKKPPFWLFTFWFMGLSTWLVMLKNQLPYAEVSPYVNWFATWLAAAIMAFVVGVVLYWVIAGVFHIFVLISGGKKPFKVSRLVYMYSGLPTYCTVFVLMLLHMLIMGDQIFTELPPVFLIYFWLIAIVAASLYSVYLAYTGLRQVQQIGEIRGVIFFLAIPIIFYLFSGLYTGFSIRDDLKSIDRVDVLMDEINNTEGGMTDEQLERLMKEVNK
jgi:hypothetical protein